MREVPATPWTDISACRVQRASPAARQRPYEEDSPLQCNVYGPGDLALLRRGRVKGVTFSRDNWMLEYGRGLIPTSLPFALMTCHDPGIIARTVWMYGRHTVKELLRGKI